MTKVDSKKPLVVVMKGDTPQECLINGLDKLGGISKFIKKDDVVFLKTTLRLPFGFPNNSNIDLVDKIILECKKAEVKKIFIGAYSSLDFSTKSIDLILGLSSYFENKGVEFVNLDERYELVSNDIKIDENEYSNEKIKDLRNQIPELILNVDKIILINQINIHPLFMCDLSLLNLYSILPPKFQKINYTHNFKEIVQNNQYIKDLVLKIIDLYSIVKPTLVINDIFYALEKAGPFIYKDSKLKKNNILIVGNDALATDIITLKSLGFDIEKNPLILECKKQAVNPNNFDDIKCYGEDLDELDLNLIPCYSNLDQIRAQNITIHSGEYCSGCYHKAYELLNFIKTLLPKDLKYLKECSLLIGLNPPEPMNKKNILLFGECAKIATQNYDFHKVSKIKGFRKKKEIQVQNKAIFKIDGCPPSLKDSFCKIYDYFGKKNLPELNLIYKLLDSLDISKYNK
ncbi:MAG: DUF362 domain-containing protein [Candidatus Lokiarchaeota archaeon]|nr:DUF362 domain-containing protein [Candidatus Lokiarchaeota archaeon]